MGPIAPSSAVEPGTGSVAARRFPGLDGLRGLAVVWVLAFHLWPDAVRGGWLGVGLFFTLSGYLIAGLIDSEVTATGRLRLGRFMARRVRRLLPAALVTIAATLVLTAVLDDQPLRIIGIDALTATLNVFNWHASLDEVGYAGIFADTPEPLAHFWSLAIEEQFYLVFPAAVALIRRPGRVVAAMAVLGLGGVWLWWGSTDAYVATPVRALEIAAGAGLALAQARFDAVRRWFDRPARTDGLARVGWGVMLAAAAAVTAVAVARLEPDHPAVFRGAPQLMALCWVVLVVAAVRPGLPARVMSWSVLRWLGLRSYAIYLFHWPVIELTGWHPLAVIAVTLAAAEISFHWLEMPVRRGTGRWAIAALAAAAVTMAVVAGAAAAASSPARGIAERAEGADELPAWVTAPDTAAGQPAAEPSTAPTTPDPGGDGSPAGSAAPAAPTTSPPEGSEPSERSGTEDPSAPDEPPETDGQSEQSEPSAPDEVPEREGGETAEQPAAPDPPAPEEQDSPGEGDAGEPDPVTATTAAPVTVPPQPDPALPVPIITVIGDSAAIHIAHGLRHWADETRTMAVVDHSRIGCSPVAVEDSEWVAFRGELDDDPEPIGLQPDIVCRDDYIEPGSTVVLVVDHGAVLFDHLNADGSWSSILEPRFAASVADSYRRLVATSRERDIRVVFTTSPALLVFGDDEAAEQPQTDPARARAYNALIARLAAELNAAGGTPTVGLIDAAPQIDSSGYDGRYGRSDGMHVDYERAELFAAEVLGPALLALLQPR